MKAKQDKSKTTSTLLSYSSVVESSRVLGSCWGHEVWTVSAFLICGQSPGVLCWADCVGIFHVERPSLKISIYFLVSYIAVSNAICVQELILTALYDFGMWLFMQSTNTFDFGWTSSVPLFVWHAVAISTCCPDEDQSILLIQPWVFDFHLKDYFYGDAAYR